MDRHLAIALASVVLSTILLVLLGGCSDNGDRAVPTDRFRLLPQFKAGHTLIDGADTLQPVRTQMRGDTLLVSYVDRPFIDLYGLDLIRMDRIMAGEGGIVRPSAFSVTDSLLVATDIDNHRIVICNRRGEVMYSFDRLPDDTSTLRPYGLTVFHEVAYITDIALHRVLAVSLSEQGGVSEPGELILTIPADTERALPFPTTAHVTADGRLLVASAHNSRIETFTCDGQFIYDFDSIPVFEGVTLQAIDVDNVADPSMKDTTSFDPSGIRAQGRIHAVDSHNQCIHMFSTIGRYLGTYAADSAVFVKPSGIAVHHSSGRIFVADPGVPAILEFRY